jgi:hypothetical protein
MQYQESVRDEAWAGIKKAEAAKAKAERRLEQERRIITGI